MTPAPAPLSPAWSTAIWCLAMLGALILGGCSPPVFSCAEAGPEFFHCRREAGEA